MCTRNHFLSNSIYVTARRIKYERNIAKKKSRNEMNKKNCVTCKSSQWMEKSIRFLILLPKLQKKSAHSMVASFNAPFSTHFFSYSTKKNFPFFILIVVVVILFNLSFVKSHHRHNHNLCVLLCIENNNSDTEKKWKREKNAKNEIKFK